MLASGWLMAILCYWQAVSASVSLALIRLRPSTQRSGRILRQGSERLHPAHGGRKAGAVGIRPGEHSKRPQGPLRANAGLCVSGGWRFAKRRKGYGHAYTQLPFSRMEEFRWLEREVREQRRGLWAQ